LKSAAIIVIANIYTVPCKDRLVRVVASGHPSLLNMRNMCKNEEKHKTWLINCGVTDRNQSYVATCTNEIMAKMW